MRYIGSALFVALVAFGANTASAQVGGQTFTMTLGSGNDSGQVVLTPVQDASDNAAAAAKTPAPSAAELAKILAGINLSQTQKDAVAKLDKAREKTPAEYDDAHYLAAIRVLLTSEQSAQLDAKLDPKKPADNTSGGSADHHQH